MKKLLFTLICVLAAISQASADVPKGSYIVMTNGTYYVASNGSSLSAPTTFDANALWLLEAVSGNNRQNDNYLKHVSSGKYLHLTGNSIYWLNPNYELSSNGDYKFENKACNWFFRENENYVYYRNQNTYKYNGDKYCWWRFNYNNGWTINAEQKGTSENPTSTSVKAYIMTVSGPSIQASSTTLFKGGSITLSLGKTYSNTALGISTTIPETGVTWTSSNSENVRLTTSSGVATVTCEKSVATQTNITLTATYGGNTYTQTVTLMPDPFVFSETCHEYRIGDPSTYTLPTLTGSSLANSAVFTSSNPTIATVSYNVIGITEKKGSSIITATYNGYSVSYELRVLGKDDIWVDLTADGWSTSNNTYKVLLKDENNGILDDGSYMIQPCLEVWRSSSNLPNVTVTKVINVPSENTPYMVSAFVRTVRTSCGQYDSYPSQDKTRLFAKRNSNANTNYKQISGSTNSLSIGSSKYHKSRWENMSVMGQSNGNSLTFGIENRNNPDYNWVNFKDIILTPIKMNFSASEFTSHNGNLTGLPVLQRPTEIADKTVSYTSSSTDIATVNSSTGAITLRKTGETTITATVTVDNISVTASYVLKVTADGMSFNNDEYTAYNGVLETPTLNAGGATNITYSSSDQSVATVTNSGDVTCRKVGVTTITATGSMGGILVTASYLLYVKVSTISFSELTVTALNGVLPPTMPTLPDGTTVSSYSSSNTSVATVDNSGNVTCRGIGQTTITASATMLGQTVAASYTLFVTNDTELSFDKSECNIMLANKDSFVAPTLSKEGYDTGLTYSSSNDYVASVNSSTGEVTIKNAGTTTISANVTLLGTTISASYIINVYGDGAIKTFSLGSYRAIEKSTTIALKAEGEPVAPSKIEYTKDGGLNWKEYEWDDSKKTYPTLDISVGETITFYAEGAFFSSDENNYFHFAMTGKVAGEGTVGEGFSELPSYCFYGLYDECAALTSAPALPVTSLNAHCYQAMFRGCSELTSAPALNATSLKESCYQSMFEGCVKLAAAPAFPNNTQAAVSCFKAMLKDCRAITTAPDLTKVTSYANYCFESMFEGCSGLTTHPTLPTNNNPVKGMFKGMFKDCTSLTSVFNMNYGKDLTDEVCESMYEGCTSLTTVSGDWSKNVGYATYRAMFKNCSNLVSANISVCPQNNAAESYLESMFEGCVSLASSGMPRITHTEGNAKNSCKNMFKNCKSLTTVPANYFTSQGNGSKWNLAEGCYQGMFEGCVSLTNTPELPCKTLAVRCYEDMFNGCTALGAAPILPATSMVKNCYARMFANCSALAAAPELNASTLVDSCYAGMFKGCGNLSYIQTNFDYWNESGDATVDWVQDVAASGRFIGTPTVVDNPICDESHIPTGWLASSPDYFCITVHKKYGQAYIKLYGPQCASPIIQYRINNGDWTNCVTGNNTLFMLTLDKEGDKAYFRSTSTNGTLNTVASFNTSGELAPKSTYSAYYFDLYGNGARNGVQGYTEYTLSGNIMSLIDMSCTRTDVPDYTFAGLFLKKKDKPSGGYKTPANVNHIVDASELKLPATKLGVSCYEDMFRWCTKLKAAPAVLPAKTVSERCYMTMFDQNSELVVAPELHATQLASECYRNMFQACVNLVVAPDLPAPTSGLASGCYRGMFLWCNSLRYINVAFDSFRTDFAWEPTHCWLWFDNESKAAIPATGTFVCPSGLANEYQYNSYGSRKPRDPSNPWDMVTRGTQEYLCFIANNANTKIQVNRKGNDTFYIYYKKNLSDATWTKVTVNTSSVDLATLGRVGDMLFVYVENNDGVGLYKSDASYCSFSANKEVAMAGNVMSLCSDASGNFSTVTTAPANYFRRVFEGFSNMKVAPKLPATTVEQYAYCEMFKGCTGLVVAPEIHAETLNKGCFQSMFEGCTNMKTSNSLNHASALAEDCYKAMFKGCSSLAMVPEVETSTLAAGCFESMFENCTSLHVGLPLEYDVLAPRCYKSMYKGCSALNSVSALEAADLAKECYMGMFEDCTSLTVVPQLNAENMVESCYREMFKGCSSLVNAPDLPSKALTDRCYQGMFQNCVKLVQAPELPAVTLRSYCYANMFYNCKRLNYIKAAFIDWKQDLHATDNWVYKVANKGSFVSTQKLTSKYADSNGDILAQYFDESMFPKNQTYKWIVLSDYLCFTSRQDGSKVKLTIPTSAEIEYYMPGASGAAGSGFVTYTTTSKTHTLNNKGKIYFRAKNANSTNIDALDNGNFKFAITTGLVDVSGYATSLLRSDYEEVIELTKTGAFKNLFYNCAALQNAKDLVLSPEILSEGCYEQMFNGCKKLTTAPELPSKVLASGCYKKMFNNCASLKAAPELPAERVYSECYSNMFFGCANLTSVPSQLPATTLENSCYIDMFHGCSSITTAPALPATTLAEKCYQNMFYDCSKLAAAPELPATDLEQYCYYSMFRNCKELTTAPKLYATVLRPYSCTYMFTGCENLTEISVDIASWKDTNGKDRGGNMYWVRDVSTTGTFVCPYTLYEEKKSSSFNENRIPYDSYHKWYIKFMEIKFNYKTNLLTISGSGIQYSKSAKYDAEGKAIALGKLEPTYTGPVNLSSWANSANKLDSITFYARAKSGKSTYTDIDSITIYRYPKMQGYCLATNSQALKNALYYAKKASSIIFPVKVFMPEGTYALTTSDNVEVGEWVSLIGESTENTFIQVPQETGLSSLRVTGSNAYLQGFKVVNENASKTGVFSIANTITAPQMKLGSSNRYTLYSPQTLAAQSDLNKVTDWVITKDRDQAVVNTVSVNGNTLNISSSASIFFVKMENGDWTIMNYKNSFFEIDDITGEVVVRAANSRGGFGAAASATSVNPGGDPVVTLNLNSEGYKSFYNYTGSKLQVKGASAFVVDAEYNYAKNQVTCILDKINKEDIIDPDEAVILFGKGMGDDRSVELYQTDESPNIASNYENCLKGNKYGKPIVYDNESPYSSDWKTANAADTIYTSDHLSKSEDPYFNGYFYGLSGSKIVKLNHGGRIKPNIAYLFFEYKSSTLPAPSVRMVFRGFEDIDDEDPISTAITELGADTEKTEDVFYDLSGLRTSRKSGLLIRNGKLIFVK